MELCAVKTEKLVRLIGHVMDMSRVDKRSNNKDVAVTHCRFRNNSDRLLSNLISFT